ncbi:helix-turn-helix transcriptional regulator [Microlunatus speluncae]|uniref:helix-turn-helix transcriptional regulator n=1 Tax=Microlunatus speluncae TaxID=2594267 RepID=UPI001375D8CA|nr:AraC family transcriptional regulator [Microlunatus speluncae]
MPRLIGAGAHVAGPGQDFPLHSHGSWEVVYYASGRARCPIGDETYDGVPGTILATPPATPHAELTVTGYANRYIQLDAPPDRAWPRASFDDGAGSLGRLFDAITHEFLRPAPDRDRDRDRMLALLTEQLDLQLRRAAAERSVGVAEQTVAAAEWLIEQRFADRLRVADLCVELSCSPSALRSYFGRLRGISPRAYLRSVRLRHALGYLRNSTLTLQKIATLCGYDSVSHLSRHIKAETGTSPGTLRAPPVQVSAGTVS